MKEIKAVIQKFMFPKVLDALRGHPELPGLTISEVKGFGKAGAGSNKGESLADLMESSPKIKLEIVVPDHTVEGLVEIIRANAHTGNPGDGKIFVAAVDQVIKVRTGEREGLVSTDRAGVD